MYLPRQLENDVAHALTRFPVVAVTGPRQCGKSTMVKNLLAARSDALYLDLERPSDLRKLNDPEWFFSTQKDKLICIDEIQRYPELFPVIRALVDVWNRPGCFLVLGSASRDLLRQSSESLAGRIIYKRLTPLLANEVTNAQSYAVSDLMNRGGFPRSLLAPDDQTSYEWRESFVATFLERDLRQWEGFSQQTMSRLWQMLAHLNGQTLNYSALAATLGCSDKSVRNYIDLLASTYMVELIPPFVSNLGKRLIKAPRLYIVDPGITLALLGIESFTRAMGHPGLGALWEQTVLASLIGNFPNAPIAFYRTSNGCEIDFVMRLHDEVFAIECKASLSPTLSRGNYNALADIAPKKTFVVTPGNDNWAMAPDIDCVSLVGLLTALRGGAL